MEKLRLMAFNSDHWEDYEEWPLGDFLYAMEDPRIRQAEWGKFLLVKTVIGEHIGYTLWLGDTAWMDEDLGKLADVIRENL